MITIKLLLIVILPIASLITGAANARGADVVCPVGAMPRIDINVTRGEEQIKTDISLRQLRQAAEGHHPGPLVGLYIGALRYGIRINDTLRRVGAGRFCATPKYVTVIIELDRIIHIPREFADDPCLAALARDHEAKHAGADATAFDHFRPSLGPVVGEAVRRATSVAGVSRADALAALTRAIQTDVNRVFDDMATERHRLDAAVDSEAELERLKTACDGRAAGSMGNPTISQHNLTIRESGRFYRSVLDARFASA
jgi:hypothetical protein